MDLERGLLRMIDEYIFDALAATGTRRAPRSLSHDEPCPEPYRDPADLEPQTEDTDSTVAIIIDEKSADAVLVEQVTQRLATNEVLFAEVAEQVEEAFAQLTQDLAVSESVIEPLPRERAARGSVVDLDHDVTGVRIRIRTPG